MDNKDYLKRGYTKTFEKESNERKIPFLSQFDVQSYIEGVPADLLHGGVIKSRDGKLKIDLDNGTITYDDGITVTDII